MSRQAHKPAQFGKGRGCRLCGMKKHRHARIQVVGPKGKNLGWRYHCPDPDPPAGGREDDPWEPDDRENPGDRLFDRLY